MPKIKMPARSFYDRTHDVKGDVNMGRMYPVLHEEVNPGDTFSEQCEMLIRMNPMIRPIMHELSAYVRFFFVRDWTIFPEFDEMISKGPDGESTVTLPMNGANYTVAVGSNEDWLNINPGVYDANSFNTMAKRSFNKCYNDWYRPQNQVPDEIDLESQADLYTTWERDQFTSVLPFTQRGPQVVMPLGTSAPVTVNDPGFNVRVSHAYSSSNANLGALKMSGSGSSSAIQGANTGTTVQNNIYLSGNNISARTLTGTVDLSQGVNGISINDWRNYMQVQAWMELNALGGVRYPELVLAHFGVVTPDARVERAEYLGSMKVPVIVSEVLQTSSTDTTSPQGNLAGHGIGANRRNIFKRSFTEHGWIIGILTIVPKSGYQQGIPLEYQRESALDFTWPLFTRLGMRDMPIKTLFTGAYLDSNGHVTTPENGTWTPVSNPNATFGYYTIYDELRYKSNSVHGRFRDNLSFWHLNRIFETAPALSKEFVECHPQTERIKAVTTESDANVQIVHRLKCYRELPKNPTPWHF
nr:MAG: major capsid protein [Microviridae sp.]